MFNNAFRILLILALLLAVSGVLAQSGVPADPLSSAQPGREVWVIPVDGPIGPATSDFYARALSDAESAGASAVIMTLDTPGGLDAAMRDMIKTTLASQTPVIAYVTPQGARAASAGTYLMYAAHIAAMSPATNVGSSTPVSLGSPLPLPRAPGTPDDKPAPSAPPNAADQTAMQRKIVNDAAAYIRSLAELRGRNSDWAERSVREGANLSATAALELGVIDLIANNLTELLAAVDGRSVTLAAGQTHKIVTAGARQKQVEPDWRHRFLSTITNPNIAYLLLMIGLYGLILEFYNPGMGAPGIVGVICLLLGAYALQMLPINYVGLGLIAFGILLMIAEAMAPSFGILGLGGIAAFLTGSVILFDSELPGFRVSLYLIGALAASSAAVFLFALGAIIRARHRPLVSGIDTLIGAQAVALADFTERGRVHVSGEDWDASCTADDLAPILRGDPVEIIDIDGLTLEVRKKE